MRIKMLTTRLGSDTENNWSEGQVFNVPPSIAREKELLNQAIALEPYPSEQAVVSPPEKAITAQVEKAVDTPPEKAEKLPEAKTEATPQVPFEVTTSAKPAADSDVKIEIAKPAWGKK